MYYEDYDRCCCPCHYHHTESRVRVIVGTGGSMTGGITGPTGATGATGATPNGK